MKVIDLRSDTITLPTDEMRKAMIEAQVGDDVYEDDLTVKKLEEMAAKTLGKEAALFVPSGTFGNQLALLTHTKRGDEVILESNCHIVKSEVGGASVIAGVQLKTIEGNNGAMDPKTVERVIRTENIHFPRTGLICMENANSCGSVLPIENMKKIKEIAEKRDVPVHLDGARIFNAAKALDVEVKEIAKYTDSIMFCLSKGLGAPIGSMLVGEKDFIKRARKNRKLMGGGLRQVGIIAAAGIVALEKMVDRLEEDHANSRYIAEKLSEIRGIRVKPDRNDINMVFFTIDNGFVEEENFVSDLYAKGIKLKAYPPFGLREEGEYRIVTNKEVSRENVEYVVDVIRNLVI